MGQWESMESMDTLAFNLLNFHVPLSFGGLAVVAHVLHQPILDPKTDQGEEDESYAMAESMDPELYRATTKGHILEFKKVREHGPLDKQYRSSAGGVQLDPQKNTVLHIATSCGHYEIVKLLCKDLPFYVTEKNSKGDTPLHIAARAGDSLLVTLLINCDWREGALELENEEGTTALHEALGHRHRKVAWILINKNPSAWYSVNKEGKSVLYLAAEAGFVDLVKLLMEDPVGNCFVKGGIRNKTPVHAAIIGKSIDSKELLRATQVLKEDTCRWWFHSTRFKI